MVVVNACEEDGHGDGQCLDLHTRWLGTEISFPSMGSVISNDPLMARLAITQLNLYNYIVKVFSHTILMARRPSCC